MPKKFAIMTLALAGLTQPLQAFEFTDSMSEDLTPLVEISRDDSGITVDYTFPGAQKIAGLTTGVVRSVECNPDEKEATIDLQSQPTGVYVVELRGNGVLYDTKKIMVK